jgi:uracil-DNA glycosylase family 4
MGCTFENFSRFNRFHALVQSVKHCNLCPRMLDRPKVLSDANGNISSKVLFIAEAPGRLGADKTKIPLFGDKTGNNFELLLSNMGWARDSIFITNAILCNPRCENGNNATPTEQEILNCSYYLRMTIDVVNPDVIITLGNTALKALYEIRPHSYSLKTDVRRLVDWMGRKLFIAYHPGPRAIVHRSPSSQRADFYELSKLVDPMKGLINRKKKPHTISEQNIQKLLPLINSIMFFTEQSVKISKFKLVKLLYLADLHSMQKSGKGITGSYYLRQVDGPWTPDIDKALKALEGFEIQQQYKQKMPFIMRGPSPRFGPTFTNEVSDILLDTMDRFGALNNSQIKIAAYKTEPMVSVLKAERDGENKLNKPVLWAKTGDH